MKRTTTARKRAAKAKPAPVPTTTREAADFTDLKRKYLEALIKRVEEGEGDVDLLDRVQRILFEQDIEADVPLSRARQPQSRNPENTGNDGS